MAVGSTRSHRTRVAADDDAVQATPTGSSARQTDRSAVRALPVFRGRVLRGPIARRLPSAPMPDAAECPFCRIRDGAEPSHIVLDEADVLAFLDQRPLFPGHVLVIPRAHYATLADLPVALTGPLFAAAQRVSAAVMAAMGADGTFVALNNVVSQSVPHIHMHVVPRRRKDGLRGFFWPRQRYASESDMAFVAALIRDAVPPAG
jgi:histidine triad (HIT) family protein